jgi:hypothetical protein
MKCVYLINEDGTVIKTVFKRSFLNHAIKAKTSWRGENGVLHVFPKFGTSKYNKVATKILAHPGIKVFGFAVFVTGDKLLYAMDVAAPMHTVNSALSTVGFCDEHYVVPKLSSDPRSEIYFANNDDRFLAKMAL